ncbi:ATP-binding protein [Pedobacter panaciterrae]|uniref:ATP-binding protein n=1 Tax=Pedobacter panaciterrae TaxID=363849 RepID=UPI00155D9BCB|nr:ATP-binding protein [Pedobacter panaciterrae]NQX55923.1 ATP-binding protein [Pedobacter panaciterrae]
MYTYNYFINDSEKVLLDDLFVDDANKQIITRLISEHRYFKQLNEYGLPIDNKMLLNVSQGCGKTYTVKAIASGLEKNLIVLNLSNILSGSINDITHSIKTVFNIAAKEKAVLFIDEFDEISKVRSVDVKDGDEMGRLVNTMIHLIDYYPDNALLICATDYSEFIEPSLLRCFDLSVTIRKPSPDLLDDYYDKLLSSFPASLRSIERMYSISFAQARDHALAAVKKAMIDQIESR